MTMPEDIKNYGFIESSPQPNDFISGVQSDIVYQEVLPSGDWSNFLPSDESQNSVYMDTMACVSFSANNVIESQLNQSKNNWQWLEDNGYIENSKVNFSDRFLAKMSGTTQNGNTLQKVADTLRHFGAVPEKDWNYPREQRQPVFVWEDYYADIPQSIIDKGQEFLKRFEIQYEWVTDDIPKHLKQSPLQIAMHPCPPWTEEVAYCGNPTGGHAIELYKRDNEWRIYDSYIPYRKSLSDNYVIPYFFKIIIKSKFMYQLYKHPTKNEEIYAVVGNCRRHIGNYYTLSEGNGIEWSYPDIASIPVADVTLWSNLTEGAEIIFSPHD